MSYTFAKNSGGDVVNSNTSIHLDFKDRLKVLFGKTIHLTTEVEVSKAVNVINTTSSVTVDRMFPKKSKDEGSGIMMSPA